jgi:hypothetical protein
MYQGTIAWWSHKNGQGVASVTENGVNTRYFILLSRVLSAPDEIRPGYYVQFTQFLSQKRPDLLPLAVGVKVSRTPFVDAGANALAKAGAQ